MPSSSQAYSWQELCLFPTIHQSENTFCPQLKYVSNSNMSTLHPPPVLSLFIKDIDPDQMLLPADIALKSQASSPSAASHAMKNERP